MWRNSSCWQIKSSFCCMSRQQKQDSKGALKWPEVGQKLVGAPVILSDNLEASLYLINTVYLILCWHSFSLIRYKNVMMYKCFLMSCK